MSTTHSESDSTETPNAELDPAPGHALAMAIAEFANEKKAENLVVLRVRELVQYTDYFVILSGHSDRQVKALRGHLQDAIQKNLGLTPYRVEGTDNHHWVILDYSDVVVHLFYEPTRAFYELEDLWSEAPKLTLDFVEESQLDPYDE